jgi:hypothetical protein
MNFTPNTCSSPTFDPASRARLLVKIFFPAPLAPEKLINSYTDPIKKALSKRMALFYFFQHFQPY